MSVARSRHTATTLPNGLILVTGGYNDRNFLNPAVLYSPSQGTWTTTGNMNVARRDHTASTLANGLVLVTGGRGMSNSFLSLSSAELYNSSTRAWTSTGNMSFTRDSHTATTLANGLVLVAGRENNDIYLNSAELYNPSTGTWTTTENMTFARYSHTASTLSNGKVLVTGGQVNDNVTLNSAEFY
ncbi:unnamed protein product [Adineta steineri]|uniref:Uncharacterized protein n=1 Tax=Adineta steineri TaxID=433720 RepID=A0A816AC51_9BILA|nr:unnamed protein product [Adineta steineri]CAF1594110.1 unnamed protein product [Adineta steineri]